MNIVTQKTESVKREKEKKTAKETWSQKKAASAIVAEKMFNAGYKARAYRMKDCARLLTMKTCPECGHSTGSSAVLCRDRICPTCQWRLSLKRYVQMVQALGKIQDIDDYHAMFLTLTVKNCWSSRLREELGRMSESWNRLLQRRPVKKVVAGWARSLEITYNEEKGTFHPHYHVILLIEPDCDMTFGELQYNFNEWWRLSARLLYKPITDIRKIVDLSPEEDNKKLGTAITETFKYAVKDSTLIEMPMTAFSQYVEAVDGKRMVAYGGIIKEARKELGIDDDELEGDTAADVCRECGGMMVQEVLEWSFTEKTYKRIKEAAGVGNKHSEVNER